MLIQMSRNQAPVPVLWTSHSQRLRDGLAPCLAGSCVVVMRFCSTLELGREGWTGALGPEHPALLVACPSQTSP